MSISDDKVDQLRNAADNRAFDVEDKATTNGDTPPLRPLRPKKTRDQVHTKQRDIIDKMCFRQHRTIRCKIEQKNDKVYLSSYDRRRNDEHQRITSVSRSRH